MGGWVVSNCSGRLVFPSSTHPPTHFNRDRFRGKAAKHEVEDGEEDNGGIATAGQVEAPWMLRPLYETAPTLRAEEEDGRGGQKKRIKKEEEDEEEDEDEVFDESTQEGWQAAIERTFEETRNKQGLVPRVKGGTFGSLPPTHPPTHPPVSVSYPPTHPPTSLNRQATAVGGGGSPRPGTMGQ